MSLEPNPRRNDYLGDGSTDTYDYDFPISSESELLVKTLDTDYNEVTLVLNTDYSVSGVEDQDGGSITLLESMLATPLDSGVSLVILGRQPVQQQVNIGSNAPFRGDVVEAEFDNLTKTDQEQQEQIGRSLKIADTIPASSFDPTLPKEILDPANAEAVIIINETNDGFKIGPTVGAIAGASAAATAAAASAAAALASENVAVAAAVQSTQSAADAAAFAEMVGTIEEVDTSGGDVSRVLPAASAGSGFRTYINTDFVGPNGIDVTPTGGDLIHGQASDRLNGGEFGKYWSNGVDAWYKLN